jgi:phenylalanyl-tRNA synthetase alpha chain
MTASREDWEAQLDALSGSARESVDAALDLQALEAARLSLLGRKGRLTLLLKALKDLPIEAKRTCGPKANQLKEQLNTLLDDKRLALESTASQAALAAFNIDRSLPASPAAHGRRHPITETIEEMAGILAGLGFTWADGPLVETEHYNFEALNIPEDHSARDMQDTFYLQDVPLLMRTHTSPVQIRFMEKNRPPIRIMAPGRVFRHEAVDASHSAVFHQVEGLVVDKNVTLADLKNVLDAFMQGMFGPKTQTRLRPSYFPFTEPSAEVDVQCLLCGGKGCSPCKGEGWMEMLGAGVVNPAVLSGVGLDPNIYSGYAFGVGVERVAMLRYGIPDIRMFYENDVRFLEQFG